MRAGNTQRQCGEDHRYHQRQSVRRLSPCPHAVQYQYQNPRVNSTSNSLSFLPPYFEVFFLYPTFFICKVDTRLACMDSTRPLHRNRLQYTFRADSFHIKYFRYKKLKGSQVSTTQRKGKVSSVMYRMPLSTTQICWD